jgi:malate dehydrogenase (oxaloacetate-decarboxylating)
MDPLELHSRYRGKLSVKSKVPLENKADLSVFYTPGVAAPCREIAKDKEKAYEYTSKGNLVAVVTDGSAVLGLGNIGPEAALPVMEGKCVLFQRLAGVDAWPICLDVHDVDGIVAAVKAIAPGFGGINIEDIAAPQCFEIERRLQADLAIPVVHDDQHATAVVVLAGLFNALKIVGKKIEEVRIVMSGAGAAGIAIADLLLFAGAKDIVLCDRGGAISKERGDLNDEKKLMLARTNPRGVGGSLAEAMAAGGGCDVFIGVSSKGLVTREMVASMRGAGAGLHGGPIVFAMANPDPEIMPDEAKAGGAAVVGTGRSDLPNQLNNVLVFPGLFRGALDRRVRRVTNEMFLRAAKNLAALVAEPTAEMIIPGVFDERVVPAVAGAILHDNI